MSELHLRKIKTTFEKSYKELIDLSDAKEHDRDSKFLSRSLLVAALELLCELSPEKAAQFLTDGPGDNGIDAVYFHPEERSLYLFQSKWSQKGTKTIEVGDVHKFIQGAKDVLDKNKAAFKNSTRMTKLWPKVEYGADEASRIQLVIVINSENELSPEAVAVLDSYKKENNSPSEIIFSRVISQAALYEQVTGTANPSINIEAPLFDWGQVRDPYRSVYGQVYCAEMASWYSRFGERLFAPNIRSFLGDTEVNQKIVRTLEQTPELFWYFNNGVTAICESLERRPAGGGEFSSFVFQNLRIVNGAQTVGAIHKAFQEDSVREKAESAKVHIKVISLKDAHETLGKEITINTNTQNRVGARDFLALDKLQERLKIELAADGVTYVFKAGETVLNRESGFDLDEAAVALACSKGDHALAVVAKRNVGMLVTDERPGRYKDVFTDGLTGQAVWQRVQALRRVDGILAELRGQSTGRAAQVLVHGNRLIAHCVFSSPKGKGGTSNFDQAVRQAAAAMNEAVNEHCPDSYMAVLFKNTDKSGVLSQEVLTAMALPRKAGGPRKTAVKRSVTSRAKRPRSKK